MDAWLAMEAWLMPAVAGAVCALLGVVFGIWMERSRVKR